MRQTPIPKHRECLPAPLKEAASPAPQLPEFLPLESVEPVVQPPPQEQKSRLVSAQYVRRVASVPGFYTVQYFS